MKGNGSHDPQTEPGDFDALEELGPDAPSRSPEESEDEFDFLGEEDWSGEEAPAASSCSCQRGAAAKSSESFHGGFDSFEGASDLTAESCESCEEDEFLPLGFGQIGGTLNSLGRLASTVFGLGEEELEEDEDEDEDEFLAEEALWEEEDDVPGAATDLTESLAARAAQTSDPREALALAGGITINIFTSAPAPVQGHLPDVTRHTIRLVRYLRRRPRTRVLVRTVPTIVRGTVRQLLRHARRGSRLSRRRVARIQATQTRRVFGSRRRLRHTLASHRQRQLRSARRIRAARNMMQNRRRRLANRAERFE